MNQAPTLQPKANGISQTNLFEGAFESQKEFEQAEKPNDLVPDTEERRKTLNNNWVEFLSLKTEVVEGPVSQIEIQQTTIETEFSQPLKIYEQEETKADNKPVFLVEDQKGSGSILEEAGIKLDFPALLKESKKTIFGIFSIFKEIFMDTVTLVVGKKDKKAEKVDPDPEKARAAAEKKAEKQRKNANIRAFYEGLKASIASIVSPEAAKMETDEKENINKTIKLTNVSYKGIKNSFGRLTVYAASMFEREQLDEEKRAKKIEKQQKMASATGKGPDLNMDKVAEGGFLSSTGGQGAG